MDDAERLHSTLSSAKPVSAVATAVVTTIASASSQHANATTETSRRIRDGQDVRSKGSLW